MQAAHVLTAQPSRKPAGSLGEAGPGCPLAARPVTTDILTAAARQPWNAHWSLYDRILAAGAAGKRVLVPACGPGDDAIRLAMLGAQVSAIDPSPRALAAVHARAARAGLEIDLGCLTTQDLGSFGDASFDMVVLVDALSQADIRCASSEIARVTRPGGMIFAAEPYAHARRARISPCGSGERGLGAWQLALALDMLDAPETEFFGLARGRGRALRFAGAARIEKALLRLAGRAGAMLGSRVVFSGTRKR
jgi:SAM-dependent methyltransferase